MRAHRPSAVSLLLVRLKTQPAALCGDLLCVESVFNCYYNTRGVVCVEFYSHRVDPLKLV